MTLNETLEFLLEARDPEEYFQEHFGKIEEYINTSTSFSGAEQNVLKGTIQNIREIISILSTNDRINFFVPRIKYKLLQLVLKFNEDPEQESILEKMQRKVVKKLTPSERTQVSPPIITILNEVKHYYKHSDIPPVNNFKFTGKDLSYSQALEELNELETIYNERGDKFINPEEDDPDSSVMILQLKDSTGQYYEWYDLGVSDCPTKEAKLMKHCGSNEKADSMLSLRVPLNKDQIKEYNLTKEEAKKLRKPVLTFAVEGTDDDYTLVESHGISNQKPDEKYHEAIVALFEKDIITGINQIGSYKPELTFTLDDLNSELRKKMDDLGIEEETIPTFDKEDIEAAEQSAEEFNKKFKSSHFSVFVQEDYDNEYQEDGAPYTVSWYFEIDNDDVEELGILIPDDYRENYRFVSSLNVVTEITPDYGFRGYNENDSGVVYPSNETLDSAVDSIIWDIENELIEQFYKKDLPKLIEKFPLNENYKSFGKLKKDYLDETDIELEFENGVITYSGDLISFNVESTHGNKLKPEEIKKIKDKLEKDVDFIIYNKGRPDPNQLELDLSSVQQYIKDTKLLKEMVEDYKDGLDFKFQVFETYSNDLSVTLQYDLKLNSSPDFTKIYELFTHIFNKELIIEGRIERLCNEFFE